MSFGEGANVQGERGHVADGDVTSAASVAQLISDVLSITLPATPSLEAARRWLGILRDRLEQGRLQLAVVGQFKRGKSTLLNALLGARILPSAITPLTAIPTFLRHGISMALNVEKSDGTQEHIAADSAAALHALLAARVTEEANPRNRLGLARVDVTLPNPLLKAGIVLIDTPGVGSTYLHNTETAKDTLPECDAALFVVSPDPPITEIEIQYLKALREVTPKILVILNKIDLVDGDDRRKSEVFLVQTVSEALGDTKVNFFTLSAREGLEAKLISNADELARSGLPVLDAYLADFAQTKRHAVLENVVAGKAAALVRDMAFEIELRLAACRMTITELSNRLDRFEAAEREFGRERDIRHDLLMGDRKRLLAELDARAARLRERIQKNLHWEIDAQLAKIAREIEVRESLAARIPHLFEAEFANFEVDARQTLESFLARHQERANELINGVRKLASDLFAVSFAAPEAAGAFQAKRVPYWVTAPREALADVPASILDALAPEALRRRRLHNRLALQADEIVARNVENLRWAIRQNLEDAVRTFQTALDERLRLSQDATRQAIADGLRHRAAAESESKSEVESLAYMQIRLAGLADSLEGHN
jgi:GTP-binding protein EngB required for normal cell division